MPWTNPNCPNLPDFRLFVAQVMRIGPGYCPPPLPAPAAPTFAVGSDGAIPVGSVYLAVTYLSANGETIASVPAIASVADSTGNIAVNAPPAVNNGTAWNVYAGASPGAMMLQNVNPLPFASAAVLASLATGTALPPVDNTSGSPFPEYALTQARNLVIQAPTVPGSEYTLACYNCAGHILLGILPEQPGSPLLPEVRKRLGYYSGNFGIIQSAADQGTSDSLAIPDALKELTLEDLGFVQTVWGRKYLSYNQSFGGIWGLS